MENKEEKLENTKKISSAYKYIHQSIRENLKEKMVDWRQNKSIIRIEKPTDIGRARNLGYKDKRGIIVVRVKLKRGGRTKPRPKKGRRSKRMTIKKVLKMSYRWVAESRAAKKYPSLEVLNSYQVGKDGNHYFYEVILVDPSKPEIKNDKNYSWICSDKNRKRSLRGLTSAGRKSRGLRNKHPTSKTRPSVRAGRRRGK